MTTLAICLDVLAVAVVIVWAIFEARSAEDRRRAFDDYFRERDDE